MASDLLAHMQHSNEPTIAVAVPPQSISGKQVRFNSNLFIEMIPARDENDQLQKDLLYYSKSDYALFQRRFERQLAMVRKHMPSRDNRPRKMEKINTTRALAA
jgi:hypothetical protein